MSYIERDKCINRLPSHCSSRRIVCLRLEAIPMYGRAIPTANFEWLTPGGYGN